ncbi:MAG: PorP/SprF family type IX secretion system membrane protein [Chitinophagales bacterium]
MKKLILIVTLALVNLVAGAQQLLPIHNEMYFLRLLNNPALTAYNGSSSAYGYYRNQLTSSTLNPRLGGGIVELSLWKDRIGTGLEVSSYTGGAFQIIEAKLFYAQKIRLAENHRLSLGLTGGFIQGGLRIGNEHIRDANDPEANERKAVLFDVYLGLAYQWKKLTIGFAIPNVLDARGRSYTPTNQLSGFRRSYLAHASYEFGFKNETYQLEPAVQVRINELKQVKFAANLMFNYKKMIFAGVGYRLGAGVPIAAGVRISKLVTLAYTYEVPVIKGVNFATVKGSHEVVLGLHFDRWMKKGDKANDAALARQKSAYDSLLARQAAAEEKFAEQQATVQDLTQRLNALQQALTDAQSVSAQSDKEKKEQQEKLNELNSKIEALLKQQTTTKAASLPTMVKEAADFSLSAENKPAVAGDRFKLKGVNFETNSSVLKASSFGELDQVVTFLRSNPGIRIRVVGHTDNRANATYNQGLSRQRAISVVDYLKEKEINPSRLTPIGMGMGAPVASNETEEGRAKNRRVEIEIVENTTALEQSKTEAAKPEQSAPTPTPTQSPAAIQPVKANAEPVVEKAPAAQQPKAKEEAEKVVAKPTTTTTAAQGKDALLPKAQDFSAASQSSKAPAAGDRFALTQLTFKDEFGQINEASYPELNRLVNYLNQYKTSVVRIVGHSDSQDAQEVNGLRSYLRAAAVVDYLRSKGIAAERVKALGMGPRKPIADNSTEEGRLQNRRIEVEIIQ